MSSKSTKRFVVIELFDSDRSVLVLPSRSIVKFVEDWIDNHDAWPFPAIYFDENEDEEECKLLYINSMFLILN